MANEEKPYVEVRRRDKVNGFNVCLCDKYIVETVDDTCYFLSLFGREEDVKVNTACFLERIPLVTVQGYTELSPGSKGTHFKVIQRKTGNVLHKVIYNADAFSETARTQVIMGSSEEELLSNFMRALRKTVPTPLTQRWGWQLFNWLKDSEGLIQSLNLMGFPGMTAYEVIIPEDAKVWDFVRGTILQDKEYRMRLVEEIKADHLRKMDNNAVEGGAYAAAS